MKFFEVEYMANGRRQKMTLKANNRSEAQALAKTKNAGIIVKVGETKNVPLEEQFADLMNKVSTFVGGSKIKINNLIASFRQLSVMTNAGISIHDSIKEISKSTEDKRLKVIFATINDDLNQGQSLTDAITKFKEELGDVVVAMIKLGESTGNMSESLHKLSEILQEVWENQRKFKKALRYPIIVMSAMAIAFVILMIFVVPQFREIFEQLGANLPTPTIILLSISVYGFFNLL